MPDNQKISCLTQQFHSLVGLKLGHRVLITGNYVSIFYCLKNSFLCFSDETLPYVLAER